MTVTDSLYRQYVDERYAVLRQARRLARRRPDWGLRLEQAQVLQEEIRALVRIRWFVRRQVRAHEQRDAISTAKGWHDWQAAGPVTTEDELLHGYGIPLDLNREGDPAFNGALNRW